VRSRAVRVVAIAIAAAVVAILAFPAFLALRGAGSAVFEPERFDFVLLAAAAFGIALGVQVVPWRGGRRVAVLAIFSSAALLFGLVAVFSIGLAVLPLGIVLLVVLFRALRRAPAYASRAAAALGGAAIGYSAVLLYVALIVPATAECFPNGAGTSSGRWRGSGQQQYSGGGGGISGQPGVITGYAEYSDSVVTFRCEGGRMVEFQRTAR
jgi:hypothetical protein